MRSRTGRRPPRRTLNQYLLVPDYDQPQGICSMVLCRQDLFELGACTQQGGEALELNTTCESWCTRLFRTSETPMDSMVPVLDKPTNLL